MSECIECGSEDTERIGTVSVGPALDQTRECHECGAKWHEPA